MAAFTTLSSRALLLPRNDIDTDQIIPARFLKGTSRTGLGTHLFADWRYEEDGTPRADFALNAPRAAGAEVLVAGRNFGCGSSREHAPWALRDFGFRAVVAQSFADIFRQNALKNGLLAVAVDDAAHASLLAQLAASPDALLQIDLAGQTLRLPDGAEVKFPVDPFSKACLLQGTDELGYLLSFESRIAAFEAAREEAP